MLTITTPPSQRSAAIAALKRCRLTVDGDTIRERDGSVAGRLLVCDERAFWAELARNSRQIKSRQSAVFSNTADLETAYEALVHADLMIRRKPGKQLVIEPFGYQPPRKERRSAPTTESADCSAVEHEFEGVTCTLTPARKGGDHVNVTLTTNTEQYTIHARMPFSVAQTFVEQRKTARRLVIAPTVEDSHVFTAELRKGQCVEHGRLWLSNGSHWYDALTGVRITSYHPSDQAVAEALGRLRAFEPIPPTIRRYFNYEVTP